MLNHYDFINSFNRNIFYQTKSKINIDPENPSQSQIFATNDTYEITQFINFEVSLIDKFIKENKIKTTKITPILPITREIHLNSLSSLLSSYNKYLNNFDDKFLYKKFLKYLKYNNLIISEADKNLGLVILEKSIYNDLAFEHLNNTIYYQNIDCDPLPTLNHKIILSLDFLVKNFHIKRKLFNFFNNIIVSYNKIGSFRILPKLHKNNFSTRPLVNCKNTILEPFSKLISLLLKHIVVKQPSYIKDSQNLIQLTQNLSFNENSILHSADFESLYTNIPVNKALIIISELYMNNPIEEVTTYAFNSFLKLVLENNYFSFNDRIFLQIKGIAMGTSCAPDIANLYLSFFEIKSSMFFQPPFFKRFIDDLFIINNNELNNLDFSNIYPDLNLNIVSGNKINFLDLSITFNFNNSLFFNLYNKTTNTFSYLKPISNHPNHIFKNIPLNLILRAKRICTHYSDFHYHCNKIFINLLNRGYSAKFIKNTIRNVSKLDRNSLIPYKDKSVNSNKFIFPTITLFDKPFNKYYSSILNYWQNLSKKYYKNIVPSFKISFSVLPNLQLLLVNNFKINLCIKSYFKCNNTNCSICKYANLSLYLENKFNLPIQLMSNSTCTSLNCIYIITCKNCKIQYVGETENIYTRFSNHISSINRFLSTGREPTKVASHFNSIRCNINHFSFQIFLTDCINYRLRLEDDLMIILNTKDPNGLNEKNNRKIESLVKYNKLI